jgi:tryptophan synthase alpha chain
MSKLAARFEELRAKNESALIAQLMAGDPDPLKSLEYAVALEAGGADMIAFGFPDPDAFTDSPPMLAASARAAQAKTTLKSFVQIIKEFRACSQIPFILNCHYNLVWKTGEEAFLKQVTEARADGVAILDLPIEEATNWLNQCRKYHMSRIFCTVPETPDERIKKIAEQTTGFLNLALSKNSQNGSNADFASKTSVDIERLRPLLPNGLALVLNLSNVTRESIQALTNAGVDGILVTDSILEKIALNTSPETLAQFIRELKDGTRRAGTPVS